MDELQKLYDVLVREGKYTKSFEEFKGKWSSDTDYQNQVFDVVSRDGLYTKDKQSFFQKYSGAAPVFQEQQAIAQPQVKKKKILWYPTWVLLHRYLKNLLTNTVNNLLNLLLSSNKNRLHLLLY